LAIEKLLKDIYGFYKNSSKQQNALQTQARVHMEETLNSLTKVMDNTVEKGIFDYL